MTLKKTFSTLLLAAILCAPFTISAQVTIGSDRAPSPWSVLDLCTREQQRALHNARMDTDQRNALMSDNLDYWTEEEQLEAQGLLIFNTDPPGCLEFWSGSRWVSLCESRLPYMYVTPSIWVFAQPIDNARSFTVSTNVRGNIEVTNLPDWANDITFNQTARTFTIATTEANDNANPRTNDTITVTVGSMSQPVVISQLGTNAGRAASLDFVGAFWRHDQFGERLIRMRQTTDNAWTAIATEPWIQLCLEPSPLGFPDYTNRTIYQDTPRLPAVAAHQGMSVGRESGNDIHFRIGIRACTLVAGHYAPASATDAPRYGQVIVMHNNNQTVHIIWVRQGEAADYLMRPTDALSVNMGFFDPDIINPAGVGARPAAVRWSPFNLTAPVDLLNTTNLVVRSGIKTQYPSQIGALWQHASIEEPRSPWAPWLPGAALVQMTNQYSGNWGDTGHPNDNVGAAHEMCPYPYRRPNDGRTESSAWVDNMTRDCMLKSEVRQSLFKTPVRNQWWNEAVRHFAQGAYADGFFDRRTRVTPLASGSQLFSAVDIESPGKAVLGTLIFNKENGASLFFPHGGISAPWSGADNPQLAGRCGFFWTSTRAGNIHMIQFDMGLFATPPARVSSQLGSQQASIRCVRD